MSNIIRYDCDGKSAIWPIPFPFILEDEVGVSLQLADGREKRLSRGSDYVINGQSIISVQAKGSRLVIWQNAPAPSPAALAQAANYPAAASQSIPAYAQTASAETDNSASLAELEGRLSLALSELDKWRSIHGEELRKTAQTLLADAKDAIARSLANARLELQSLLNDSQGQMSQTLAVAQTASSTAARAASEAESAVQNMKAGRAIQDNAAISAQGWANASKKSADEAYNASCHAWDAASQVSIHSRRPGVCAVQKLSDIHACSPGLFIVNPHLTHAPTPFLGVWPARSVDDMAWDAVFFVSPYLYPDDPRLPPPRPERPQPEPVEATGNGDEWLPCNHRHPQTPPPHSCPVTAATECKCKEK